MLRLRRPRFPALLARRLAAGLLAALALALALRPDPAPADPASTDRPVVVATSDLPAGTRLSAEHLAVVPLPEGAVPAGVVDRTELLHHQVLAAAVRRGEPLTDARLVGAGLTTLLPTGQVAAPVRLADLAVTALVRPGDRVDVLATGTGTGATERVASGALVLAAPGHAGDDEAGAGLLLLAVDEGTATRLATASAGATLTISLPPP
ncbi:Flp pilus assembly protein CpaB [Blastococcus sp. TBT05-19]|uniref:Flp pilus assembly protein CpaB n=1 Tax=Blastococcus sp. TBT05-19 TaxID=2250581 RepID=UPI000DEB9B61|nr:Flp pilus assembly protein CpaB [Blastococcus sp. TBT05-19]RBY94214.1 Flp pilus assembly protein CpaB [Blastococcus sp. TBT05-19]